MEISYLADLKRFQRASKWQRMFSSNSPKGLFERTVFRIIGDYRIELRHRLGVYEAYGHDLERLEHVRGALRCIDTVFDTLAEHSNGQRLVEPLQDLFEFLRDAALDMALVAQYVEGQHLEMAEVFATERAQYAESRLTEAGSIDC